MSLIFTNKKELKNPDINILNRIKKISELLKSY